jgi:hypothetical protein
MEFCSVLKKNDILSFAGKWMEIENIILSEVSQVQKAKGCLLSLICGKQTQFKNKPYYEKYIMLRGVHIQDREGKRRKLRRGIWLLYVLYKEYRIFKPVKITVRGLR